MIVTPSPMTAADAADAIGKRVEVATSATIAVVINVGPSGSVLIRSCAKKGSYHWVTAAGLFRRADHDQDPEPEWLQQARVSRRPPLVLFRILHPTVGQSIDDGDGDFEALDPELFCLRHGKPLLDGCYGRKASNCEDCEPRELDGETFRGGEAAAFDRERSVREARR